MPRGMSTVAKPEGSVYTHYVGDSRNEKSIRRSTSIPWRRISLPVWMVLVFFAIDYLVTIQGISVSARWRRGLVRDPDTAASGRKIPDISKQTEASWLLFGRILRSWNCRRSCHEGDVFFVSTNLALELTPHVSHGWGRRRNGTCFSLGNRRGRQKQKDRKTKRKGEEVNKRFNDSNLQQIPIHIIQRRHEASHQI